MTAIAAVTTFDLILKYAPLAVTSVFQVEQLIERLLDKKRTLEQATTDRQRADAELDATLAAMGLREDLAAIVPSSVAPGQTPDAVPVGAETVADALAATVREQAAELLRLRNELDAAKAAGYGAGTARPDLYPGELTGPVPDSGPAFDPAGDTEVPPPIGP